MITRQTPLCSGRQHNDRRRPSAPAAFTLVEIMIVVVIIGILLAIAVPNLTYTREKTRSKACAGNLRRIQWAKDCYLMDKNLPYTNTPTSDDLYGDGKYIKATPLCPSSGTYTIGSGAMDPTCSVGGDHNVNGDSL